MITVKCFPLAGTQNYSVEDFQSYLGTRLSGVYSSENDFPVTSKTTPEMGVNVGAGIAWLKASDFRGVVFPMASAGELSISPADALQPRIDTVVIGLDKTTRTGYLKVVTGLIGGAATAPVRDSLYYEIVIAEILVRAGTSSILQTDITDKRPDESVCGVMRDGVTGIPSATFQAQAEGIIDDMRVAIADALADAGIIDNLTTADAFKALSANMGKTLQDEKAPKASPTFTGTATIPTAAVTTLNAGAVYSPSFVGMVAFFAGTNTPAGWLKCDGAVVSRTTYANLFSFIGTTYGAGDGSTTFALPNLCDGSFIRGVGGNAGAIGVKQTDAMQAHTHTALGASAGALGYTSGPYPTMTPGGTNTTSGATGRTSTETRPLNTAMTPFIKF